MNSFIIHSHTFTHSFIYLLSHLSTHTFTHSFNKFIYYPLIQSLIYSFTYYPTHTFAHSFHQHIHHQSFVLIVSCIWFKGKVIVSTCMSSAPTSILFIYSIHRQPADTFVNYILQFGLHTFLK
uniref:Uncharacterized protein n=1 Tax=Cacopsylla melanoneura TaxID=428564 RepID=A0A8D9E1M5_9HEMI